MSSSSMFDNVPTAPPDAILGLTTQFRADASPHKVNLGVGAYRTGEGLPYVLPVVRRVEASLASDPSANHEYLPQDGLSSFCALSAQLIFGVHSQPLAAQRVVTVQALSGSGALSLAFTLIKRNIADDAVVYVPDPTWPNHNGIVKSCGLSPPKTYRYFDAATGGVDYKGMMEDLGNAPAGAIVLLHPCAHNPTGADPSEEEWHGIRDVIVKRRLIPFFDCAYQGFASGDLERDAFAVRLFTSEPGLEMFVSQSYAKNLGLYGERVGALSVVFAEGTASASMSAVRSQLKLIARTMYSSPPVHGAKIVAEILSHPQLYEEWKTDLRKMSARISTMRTMLRARLEQNGCPGKWEHITQQIGMFSYTRLTKEQVLYMREKRHVYMTNNGRMSMAGLTDDSVDYVADAMRDAILACPAPAQAQ